MRQTFFAVLLALTISTTGCGSSKERAAAPTTTISTPLAPTGNVAAVVAYDKQLSTFATLFNVSGVLASVGTRGPYTVLAPTNDAFAKLPHAHLIALLSSKGKQDLAKLIRSHVARGRLIASEAKTGSLKTLSGAILKVAKKDGVVTVTYPDGTSARIVSDPLSASNGVVFRIDAVLM